MNVLFCTYYEVSPQAGGGERVAANLSIQLSRKYGINCYSLYEQAIDPLFLRVPFENRIKYNPQIDDLEILISFVQANHIDIIIGGYIPLFNAIVEIIDRCPTVRVILEHQVKPGSECLKYENTNSYLTLKNCVKWLVLVCRFRYRQMRHRAWLRKCYKKIYDKSARVVLLSSLYQSSFKYFGKISDEQKFRIIHNPLSYTTFFDMRSYKEKKKEVLIVSRLEEVEKRISLCLRVWQMIEKDSELADWRLRIIGYGRSEEHYKAFVKTHNLMRVSFEGVQDPELYYKNASILMQTSNAEGWGLTLTEAQQFACVPVAFNSYESISEIIVDRENGFSVPNNNICKYIKTLSTLMKNGALREKMAENAVESSKRFKQDKIMEQWYHLFQEVLKQAI